MTSSLSVIVPAYNESSRLGKSLLTIIEYLNENYEQSELIVVDDGSSDGTSSVAEASFVDTGTVRTQLIRVEPNKGKGNAVRSGLLAASSSIALFTDADLSTPITEMPKLVGLIKSGEYDLTFGSRALDRSLIGVHQPWRREQGGRVFNLIVKLATGLPFYDTQCGFKAFRLSVCRPLIETATIDRFGFDVELLYLGFKAGLRLRECAVRWDHYEGSKVDVLRDSIRMLKEVRLIREQMRKGLYSSALRASSDIAKREREETSATSIGTEESDISSKFASSSHRI
jgi:dolichyl-phosphate beta-glucosyltransferase